MIVLVGASGGVGATTLAALLARRRAADGRRVCLVDLDGRRGGMDVVLGVEGRSGARWHDLAGVRGTVAASDLDEVLPRWRGVDVLSADRRGSDVPRDVVDAVLAGLAADGRTAVLDVPGWAVGEGLLPTLAGEVLLLVRRDVVGVAGAVAVRGRLGPGVRLVLRPSRARGIAPGHVADVLEAPVLGLVPDDRRVSDAIDRGLGPAPGPWSPLGRSVRHLARRLGRG